MEIDHIDATKGEPPGEHPRHFQGEARLQPLASPFPGEGAPAVFAVHFQPGGRTRPHVHRSGQVLHITAGRGIVGDRSGRREVEAGDVVAAMADEWHWHGATTDSTMTHLTVQVAGDAIDWDVDEGDWADGYGEVSP